MRTNGERMNLLEWLIYKDSALARVIFVPVFPFLMLYVVVLWIATPLRPRRQH